MEEAKTTIPKRRTLLQRAFFAVTGALGLGAAPTRVDAAEAFSPPSADGPRLRLQGRRWLSPPPAPGGAGRVVRCGELQEGPDGGRIGEFFTNAFCLDTPFGPQAAAASNLEFQTFRLPEGTLFGVGAAGAAGEKHFAVLGGTGRYAGARGSYVEREAPSPSAKPGALEFHLNLTT
jgi:hypothetical protein